MRFTVYYKEYDKNNEAQIPRWKGQRKGGGGECAMHAYIFRGMCALESRSRDQLQYISQPLVSGTTWCFSHLTCHQ